MAHLITIRNAKSFVYGKNLSYGVHEEIEQNIDKRQYTINKHRQGYNTPTGCEWKLIDYRVKKEALPEFARDLSYSVLNPYPNNITLYQIIFKRGTMRSVGKLFLIIQWLFKWINKKKTTSTLLFILSVVFLSPFCFILALIILINPIKPVEIAEGDKNKFTSYWSYNYIIGQVPDPKEKTLTGFQEDVL